MIRRPVPSGGDSTEDRPSNELTIAQRQLDGAICLMLAGELDLASVAAFIGHLTRAAEAGRNVVLDMNGLQYIDSSGINALVDAHKRFTRSGRHIALTSVSPRIARILQIVALEQLIPVFPTVEAAIEGLRQ